MKGLDILIVRFLPFVLFIIFNINVICCWNGYTDITLGYELHGNSALYALGFFLVSLANKRYHCIWNRAMYIFLIIVPIINFVDACFNLFPIGEAYIYVLWTLDILTCVITAYLAIRHFVSISEKKLDNERR